MKKTTHHSRIVVKVGTRTLSDGGDQLSRPRMIELVRQCAHLHAQGHELLLVSSGAVFAGREALGTVSQAGDIPFKQTMAAVGQVRLMAIYEQIFGLYGLNIAQALLTHADLVNRERYLNARNTLLSLLRLRVVPVINENDVVAVEEIKIGDNDNLSARVANLVGASLLVILTDQAGLLTADPKIDPNAGLIQEVAHIDDDIRRLAGESGSSVGTGGMATKIEAAEMATRSGTPVIIAPGREPDVLLRIMAGERLGTRFQPSSSQVESRKRWILAEPPRGEISVDEGAAEALLRYGKSLLAVGVSSVSGSFQRGQTVRLLAPGGREIARGITHYNDQELAAIRGRRSNEIAHMLDQAYGSTVVHRDDMVLV
ncbi:MAG: glutamate 5-kinase [Thermoflexales bacterium]|nr:glutamate 5-kinase [Thermoflexales bacterium]